MKSEMKTRKIFAKNGLIVALAAGAAASLLPVVATQSTAQRLPDQIGLPPQPGPYQIQRLPALRPQRITVEVGRRLPQIRPVEHDPAEPPRPLPVGEFRPWRSIGPRTPLLPASQLRMEDPNPTGSKGAWHVVQDDPRQNLMIARQVDVSNTPFISSNLWETNTASSGDVILFTANWDAAFSVDRGQTFTEISPGALMAGVSADPGQSAFCCDQVVQYVPQIDRFIWVIQSNVVTARDENEYRIIFASPSDIKSSNGAILGWYSYDLTSKIFNVPGSWLDFPEIAVGSNYLYMSFDVKGGANDGKAILARFPLSSFSGAEVGPGAGGEFLLVNQFWVRPVQNTGNQGIFATEQSLSKIRLIAWEGNSIRIVDSDILTIPTVNQSSIVPGGSDNSPGGPQDWLRPDTKWGTHIYGATQAGNQIWLAWNAARTYNIPQYLTMFPQSHIEGAVLDATSLRLIRQFVIYNNDFAFAYPMLATSSNGDVGITFAAGGGTKQVHAGIGFLTDPMVFTTVETGTNPSNGAGGHYMGIRPTPDAPCFATAVFDGETGAGRAFYVLYGRIPTALQQVVTNDCHPTAGIRIGSH